MKKIININFQGRVIPIEETSFDILKQYIDSLRVYFAREEGCDEIINDIESRIAELFSERLKHTACITDDDVNKVIAGIGRPEDLEGEEAADSYAAPGKEGQPAGGSSKESGTPAPRSLVRSANDSIIGGVCGGLAAYFNVDPSFVRIFFVVLVAGSFGWAIPLYVLLWIILPERALPAGTPKRLYRSREDRTIGGVAGGLAIYFNTQAWVVRLIFCIPLLASVLYPSFFGRHFFGLEGPLILLRGLSGFFAFTYLILWMILPEAVSTSEKLQMKGEKVNLQSIKKAVKEDPAPAAVQEKNNRLLRIIGTLFKAFFIGLAGIITLALIAGLMAILFSGFIGSAHILPVKDFLVEDNWQEALLWGTLVLFFCVPFIALLTWLIRRIAGIRSRRHSLAYVFGGLWIIGLFCALSLVALTVRSFRAKDSREESMRLAQPSTGKLYVEVKRAGWKEERRRRTYQWGRRNDLPFFGTRGDSLFLRNIRIKIAKSSDTAFHINYISFACGADPEEAGGRASRIEYRGIQQDSVFLLPEGFSISNKDKFRNQQVVAVIEVPVGKKIELSKNIYSNYRMIHIDLNEMDWDDDDRGWNDDWDNTYRWKAGVEYRMTENGLEKAGKEVPAI